MAQPLKKDEMTNRFFSDGKKTLEEMIAEQGIKPIDNLDALKGDFWPEEESIDDFIETLYQWRREGLPRDLPE